MAIKKRESLIREEDLEEMHIIDRKKFVEELVLRENIRGILRGIKKKEFLRESGSPCCRLEK